MHRDLSLNIFSVKWQILNPPIVFGFDVELYCNASVAKDCCTNTATWMKDFDIIVHHGASIDASKYIQTQRSDGFSLIITKFNENDINHQYTCLYDFFSYSEVLKLNPYLMRCMYYLQGWAFKVCHFKFVNNRYQCVALDICNVL